MLRSRCEQFVLSVLNILIKLSYRCPHRRAFVLDHGIIGDTPAGDVVRRITNTSNIQTDDVCPLQHSTFLVPCTSAILP